ncbi:MAG TPA: class I SAM-dependent methyltransferase, partial [Gammaproteobacteria bacterium]|nr:class I SAM-dependent methyltransferase [Gammaproteobacteria bacterium]
YRLALPATLRWVEADLAPMIEYKNAALKDAKCFCRLERHAVDLADAVARRALFTRVGAAADKVLVITEGLLIYMDEAQVKSLTDDLHQQVSFKRWLMDISSPALLTFLARQHKGGLIKNREVSFKFAPGEGVEFFRPLGWTPAEYHELTVAAKRLDRLEVPFLMRLVWRLMAALNPMFRERMRRFSGIAAFDRS